MDEAPKNFIKRGVFYIQDPTTCLICKKTDLPETDKFCAGCGFPMRGEQAEQSAFYAEYYRKRLEYDKALENSKSSRTILFVASGLSVISGVVGTIKDEDPYTMFVGFGMAVIFLILGFWAEKKPLEASVVGIVIYGSLILLSIAFFLVEGMDYGAPFGALDIVIIVVLAKSIHGALKARKLQKENVWTKETEA